MSYNLKNRKQSSSFIYFFVCILMFIQFGNLNAQSYEIPSNAIIRDYPLNEAQVNETINKKNGVKHGNFEAVKNRLGYPQGAIKFNSNSYIELPNFFEESDVSNGYSVSFWIKVDDPMPPPSGALPFTYLDLRDQIFFARKGSITAGSTLFGMARVRDRFIVNRYIPLKDPNPELEFWLWDPANLDASSNDWHFVSLVYTKNAMQVYVGKPDGTFNCRANYFAPQDLSQATFWGLGNPNGRSIANLDDFKVYSIPLTKEQVRGAFEAERPFNLSNAYKLIPKHSNNPLAIYKEANGDDFLVQDFRKAILAQDWFLKPEEGSAFSIQNAQSGFNLVPRSNALASNIKQTNFGTGLGTGYQLDGQKWDIKYGGKTPEGKDYFRIVNLSSNNYSLSISNASTTPGEKAVMWPQHSGDDQKYYIERAPTNITTIVNDGDYYIMNKKKDYLFMKVGSGSYEAIYLDRNLNLPWEQEATPWKVRYKGNGKYLISTNDVDGIGEKVIDLMPYVLTPNMTPFLNKKTQYWRFIKAGDSEQLPYYKIVNYQHSDLMLAPQNDYSDTAPIKLSPYFDNQDINYWYLVPKSYFTLKNDEYQIIPKYNSKSSLAMNADNGAFIAINSKDKRSFFNWNITCLPTGEYQIKNNGRYLKDITNYSNNEYPISSRLKLVNENPTANSYYFRWILRKRKTENGIDYYTISNHGKGVLEVENQNYSARIVKRPYKGRESQLWSFSKYNNKKCIDARPVSLGQTVYGSTTNYPIRYQDIERCSYAPGGKKSVVWYRLTGKIQQGTRITVTTCNNYTNFNTILAIYKGSSTCGLMECVAGDAYNSSFCNIGKYSKSSVTFSVLDKEKDYYIAVYGDDQPNIGDFQLDVSSINPFPLSKVSEEKALSITKDDTSTDDDINHNINIGNLYPNPTSKSVNVNIFVKDTSKVNIKISDMRKLIVLKNEFDLKTGKNLLNLNLSSISDGIYIVEFKVGNYKTSKKLVINNN